MATEVYSNCQKFFLTPPHPSPLPPPGGEGIRVRNSWQTIYDPLDRFLGGSRPGGRPKPADTQVRPYSWSFFLRKSILNPASGYRPQPAASAKGAVHTALDRPRLRLPL
jgi:hypothetical protein